MAEQRRDEDVERDDTSPIPLEHTSVFQTYAPPPPSGTPAQGPSAYDTPGHHSTFAALSSPGAPSGHATQTAAPSRTGGASAYRAAPPRRRPRRSGGVLVGALLLGTAGGGAMGYVAGQTAQQSQEAEPRVVAAVPAGNGPTTPVTAIAQHALPSVVFISVGTEGGEGVGSGFVIREDGYIVTNSHVVEGAVDDGTVQVTFSDGADMEAEIVGQDVEYDIAVLKVDQEGLPALAFGDSDSVLVGSSVVAVGAPLGLDNTVTSGIVSALGRPVIAGGGGSMSYINAIQTDAAINPGNSGGPLLDLNGTVIGVNSAIAQIPGEIGGQAGSIGLGFAIPSNQVEHTATQLIETGTSNHPIIGVMLDMSYSGVGAKVLEEGAGETEPVVPGGPADGAGITAGEVILAVDGEEIQHGSHLVIVLRSHAVGDQVEVLVQGADGSERTVTVTLQGSQ
ncbi:S1C family serine protease [Ornithinimicrobium cryptoxanthini]|uniref:Trypsin-like peptidase domain-containing protein n=1 Tax=Ornithinimicrobium cryptoxanthini TaxID=2934161 RepID=A0ABY4YK67_9MICO|nr:trypsin-like peptidase domain-containing protein [Ornithinimicrobium cryptoxanthini]USQ77116.1 trypsin-like peptidase domain-containing protein [Ornithinimicrobium cryptoxanthini]